MISTDVLIGQDTILAKQASRQSDDHDLRVLTFSFMDYRDVAEFGIGLAVAVALDAFILRTVLVPAAMHLFGDANIVLADATGELATEDVRLIRLSASKHRDHWKNYRHLRPIPAGGERRYSWDYKGAMGFSYIDALGSTYTLLTSPYGTKVVDGTVMQHAWSGTSIH